METFRSVLKIFGVMLFYVAGVAAITALGAWAAFSYAGRDNLAWLLALWAYVVATIFWAFVTIRVFLKD